ncbi:MAG: DUF4926 domain-containing protein [Thermoanaerobaculia bacterium]
MTASLFERIVLLRDFPSEGLRAGDVGTVVERYPAAGSAPEACEIEFFAANGESVAVASIPADAVRAATDRDVLTARILTPA